MNGSYKGFLVEPSEDIIPLDYSGDIITPKNTGVPLDYSGFLVEPSEDVGKEELSSLGRFGDSELRFVDGELSHVNPSEAKSIDMYGAQGENLVKAVGSGTVNPDTGLNEYWWQYVPAIISGVSWAVGSLSESSAGATQEKQADIQAEAAQDTKIQIDKQISQTKTQWQAEKEVGTADYLTVSDQLSDKTIESYETIKGDAESKIGKQNLAYGTANKIFEDRAEKLTEKITKSRSNLWDNYQRKMSDIDVTYEGQILGLESEKTAADYEQQLAETSSEQWFPWKYTGKFMKSIIPGGDRGILDDPSWT